MFVSLMMMMSVARGGPTQAVNRPGPGVRRTSGLDVLTNSAVNFWSAAAVAAVGGAAGPPLW